MKERYLLYTKPGCVYCRDAVILLSEKDKRFNIIALNDDERVLAEVKKALDWPTFPMVFTYADDDSLKLIGGYTDLKLWLEQAEGKDV